MSRHCRWIGVCLIVLIGLTGCGQKATEIVPTATGTPLPTKTLQPLVSLTPTPVNGAILAPGPITLTIWTSKEFAPSDDETGGRLLLNQLLVFDRSHQDVTVEMIIKRTSGPGSIIDYFDTASQVAPSVLPDITVLNGEMLHQAVQTQVLQPLDDLLSAEIISNLYPVADDLGRLRDGNDANAAPLLAIPFRLDLDHLVYNSSILTATVPNSWDVILESGGPYVFPAGEEASADAILSHYLATGGTFYDDSGIPRLEVDPLTEVFRFYQLGSATRVIPSGILQIQSLAESWAAYRNGNALVAHTASQHYLSGRDELLNTAVAPLPGPENAATSLVDGWYWGITTTDPSRQLLAAELLDWLMAGDNLGVWSFASHWLPATEDALVIWPTSDPYVTFAREQILLASPRPDETFRQAIRPQLTEAVRSVISRDSTPAEAASSIQ